MTFEFDTAKSIANKAKHGIDFVEAQAMWNDETRLTRNARYDGELRDYVIARQGGRLWTAVVTQRGDRIRIISVRRSRTDEAEAYLGRGV